MERTASFNILQHVDSTNNYAMAKIHAGLATHGMAWFAHYQSAGKGQRGKVWEAVPGQNIALSVVLRPEGLDADRQFYLSAATALACYDIFKFYAGNETRIKWPNDLYWRDRKAGGILIENVFAGKAWKWAVIGIGININQTHFSEDLNNPISLKQITGQEFDTIALAKELHDKLLTNYELLKSGNPEQIIKEYNDHLFRKDEWVTLKKGEDLLKTKICEVTAKGKLITRDEIERSFDFGEVEWILEEKPS